MNKIAILVFVASIFLTACGGGSDNTPPEDANRSVPNFINASVVSGATYSRFQNMQAFDYNGGSMLIWEEYNGSESRYVYRQRNATGTWFSPRLIDVNRYARIEVKSNGSQVMLIENDGQELYYRVFSGSAWSDRSTITVPQNVNLSIFTQLATNGTQFVLLLTGSNGVYTSVYDNNQWSALAPIDSSVSNFVSKAALASNGSGFAAVWQSGTALQASVYDGNNWSSAVPLQVPQNTNAAGEPQIKGASSGYAVAWLQSDGNNNRIFASNYDTAAQTPQWSTPQGMDTNPDGNYKLVLDSSNTGFVLVWVKRNAANNQNDVVARIYNGTWQAEDPLSTVVAQSNNVIDLDVVSNGSGYAVVWFNYRNPGSGGAYSAYGNVYNGTWVGESNLGSSQTYFFQMPTLSLISDGSQYAMAWADYSLADGSIRELYTSVSDGNSVWPAASAISSTVGRYSTGFDQNPLFSLQSTLTALWLEDNGNGLIYQAHEYGNQNWLQNTNFGFAPLTPGHVRNPAIAQNDNGVVVAVWAQYHGGDWFHYFNFKNGNSWNGAQQLDCGRTINAYLEPEVLSNGSQFMIFCEGLTFNQIYLKAISFDGVSLGGVEQLDQVYTRHNVATNGTGYAVTWVGNSNITSGQRAIYARIYNGSWQDPAELIQDSVGTILDPLIASNGSNYAIAWEAPPVGNQLQLKTMTLNGNLWDTKIVNTSTNTSNYTMSLAAYGDSYAVTWADGNVYSSILQNDVWQVPALEVDASAINLSQGTSLAAFGTTLAAAWKSGNSLYTNRYDTQWLGEVEQKDASETFANGEPPTIIANNDEFLLHWAENNNNLAKYYIRMYRNGAWSVPLTPNVGVLEMKELRSIGTGSRFRMTWSQDDPSNSIDPTVFRVWVSDAL